VDALSGLSLDFIKTMAGNGVHHRIELRNTAVQISHVGFGERDPLCDRRRVTIDCLPRRDLML
jgi:hypothetical protein